jgi:hypothetical protein
MSITVPARQGLYYWSDMDALLTHTYLDTPDHKT